jgi:hypothetical protein
MTREIDRPTDLDERVSHEAWMGWSALMARTGVFLSWQKKKEPDRVHAGSGIALHTPGGVPFVLTAAHVARDAFSHPSILRIQDDRRVDYPFFDCWAKCHPDERVDVAIIVPDRASELWTALLKASESIEILEASYEHTHRAGDTYIVFGYPADILKVNLDDKEIRFRSFQWPCDQQNPPILRDDDMIEFPWIDRGAPMFNMKQLDALAGPAPDAAGGMSGGPLWRHRDVVDPDTKLWTPQVACRVVAVQRAYRAASRDVYLDPAERWYDWLMRRVSALDSPRPTIATP